MQIIVFGAGSLGSLIGGLLATAHDVTLIGRDPHISAIRRDGLRITGLLDRTVKPTAMTSVTDSVSTDLAVVTVKAYDTDSAVEALSACDIDAVLSLQNGLGNEARLRRIGSPVLAGVTSYGANLNSPGTVVCTGIGEVTIGPDSANDDRVQEVASAFTAADIETTVSTDIQQQLWEKLAINAAINPITALADVDNGAILDPPLRSLAKRTATEAAAVAREQGFSLSTERVLDRLWTVAEITAENVSSMRSDMLAGQRTEIDAINGAIVDHADWTVPVNTVLAEIIRGWEAGHGLR